MDSPPKTPPLSVALRELIEKRNILTSKTKSKVLRELDMHIENNSYDKEETRKFKTLEEIYATEESYLKNLEVAMKFFRNPLQEIKLTVPVPLKVLLDHLESIYNVNGELLNQLKQHGDDVGTAFHKIAPFFKLYSVYATDYRPGIACLQELGKTNPKLDSFVKGQETRPEVCSKLSSLLISPIQRIPRYRLLLKELLTHTNPDHPHYQSILDAMKEVEKSTEHINSTVSELENMKRMVELQKFVSGGKIDLIHPGRRLIKEGVLMKVSKTKDRANPRYFILTSDILMYCKMTSAKLSENSLRCSCILPLRRTSVTPVLNDRLFSVRCNDISLILYSSEPYASEAWVKAIRRAIIQEDESESTLKRRGSSRLAQLRSDYDDSMIISPRKRKTICDDSEYASPFQSPWKKSRVKKNKESSRLANAEEFQSDVDLESIASSSKDAEKRKGYFGTLKRAMSTFGHALQRYWLPPALSKHHLDRPRIT